MPPRNEAAAEEKRRREEEKKAFKAAQELDSLKRCFKRIDKNNDGSIDVPELMQELEFLGHTVKPSEAALMIWEVDDDADGCINWEECRDMFYRVRDDQSGYEPRKLFNVLEFLMHDKNLNGAVDLDECVTILYNRFGKVHTDTAMEECHAGEGDEKTVSFSTFVNIQTKATKLSRSSGLKPGATMVPQVKPSSAIAGDPALAHLL